MGTHYLYPWDTPGEDKFDHACSGMLSNVKPGDTLWIVFNKQVGELLLIGKLEVGLVTTNVNEVKGLTGREQPFREASHYVVARVNTDVTPKSINISEVAEELRFESDRDRLTVENGKIAQGQLRQKRHLTRASAALLEKIWNT
jgi:hypothetical protein